MNCTGCGTPLNSGARFCGSCGTAVSAPSGVATSPNQWSTAQGAPPPPPPMPQPYTPPGYAYTQPKRTNGMAVTSMVLGILWLYGVGAILALIFGYIARNQIDQSGGSQSGRGMAVAGIVLGWIGIAGLLLIIIVAAASTSSTGY